MERRLPVSLLPVRSRVVLLLVLLLLAGSVGVAAAEAGSTRAGPTVGPELRVSGPRATEWEFNPAVAWNETANEYLVVWDDERNLSTRRGDIYGRRVSAAGAPIGGDFRVSGPGATSGEWTPAVAWNQTANEYLVVWSDERNNSTRGYDVYGRRVSAAGVPVGADFRISGPGATDYESDPAVAWSQMTNQYLVVWSDGRSGAARGLDIYGQRVGAGGTRVGADFRISSPNATSNEVLPVLAWNKTANQYLVVWADDRAYTDVDYLAISPSDTYGQRVSPGGVLSGAEIRIGGPNATSYVEWGPGVAWSESANQYLVVWSDTVKFDRYGWDIYGQRLSADGALVGAKVRISGNALCQKRAPVVVWNQTAKQYLVVWEDFRGPNGGGAYGQRVGAGGARVGADFRISGANAESGRMSAAAWNRTANQYLVVWVDYRNDDTRGWDIYGRRVVG